jgi:cysteinyl-tRNA synthetase
LKGVAEVVKLAGTLGMLEMPPRGPVAIEPEVRERIESLVAQRGEARRRRDFSGADRLRDELQRMGVVLEDTPDGTSWTLSA